MLPRTTAGMQHNDGGNPEKQKKKGPFLQLMEMGMAERRTHSVMHRGSLQHRELTLHLLFRLEEIICQIEAERDKKVVVN